MKLSAIILQGFIAALVVRVVAGIVGSYPGYFPPDFEAEFLVGRETEFFGIYQVAFSVHVISGPIALLASTLLMNSVARNRWPKLHRYVGRLTVVIVLILVVPSGFVMAFYAHSGRFAELGFISLALSTGLCAVAGWQTARRRQFQRHQRWMTRLFLMLFSAVVLRIIGGASLHFQWTSEWIYPVNAWVSWLVPLSAFEILTHMSSKSVNGSRGDERSAMPSRK